MNLKNLILSFAILSIVNTTFTTEEKQEQVELSRIFIQGINDDKVIIPTLFKNLSEQEKNCWKRFVERIQKTVFYKKIDNFIQPITDKFIIPNAKGIKVLGLSGIQMYMSFFLNNSVAYNSQSITGKSFSEYFILKKINPKLSLIILTGIAILVTYLTNLHPIVIPSEPYQGETSEFQGDLNNTDTNVFEVPAPSFFQQIFPENDPYIMLTDFKNTFVIAALTAALYLFDQLTKSKNNIKTQTDVNCMEIQTDENLTEDELENLNFDKNVSRRLKYIDSETKEIGCNTEEVSSDSTIMTSERESASSPMLTPNVTPEKAKRISIVSPKSPRSFKILKSGITQTPNRDNTSLSYFADMESDEDGKVLFGKVQANPLIDFALSVD